ncbi:MAG: VTT domain-containing protein [Gammaproteobacteria bacterium]|nr:VTT domain-containing protein [Gammaproteobacteria bacterium]
MNPLPLIFRGLIVIAMLVLVAWLLGDVLDRHWIDVYVREQGIAGELLFVCVAGLLISIGLSRQLVAFLAGYGFGFTAGLVLAMVAVIAGCITTFYITRLLLRDFVRRHRTPRLRKIDHFIHNNTFATTLLFRLLPVGSNWLVNIAAGASSVRSLQFFLGSALGYIPQMMIFALVGSGSQLQQFWQIAIAMAMFVAAAVLGGWLFGRYRQQQGPEQSAESPAPAT